MSVESRRLALEQGIGSWRDLNLAQWLDRVAQSHPERPFVISDYRTYTYREVAQGSRRLGRGLIASGVHPGERVAMIVANYPEFVLLTFAIARAGAVAVPINFRFRGDELGYVLRQSESCALVTMASFEGFDYLAALTAQAPGWSEGHSSSLPDLRAVWALPGSGPEGSGLPGLAELERSAAEVSEAELATRCAATPSGASAAVFYTSGTTGFPKGAVLSHEMLLRSAYGSAYSRAFEDGRRILFALPLYHVFAYIEGMLAATFAGGAIIPQLGFEPAATYRAIQDQLASEALFVPTMSIAVVDHPARRDFNTASLHAVMSAAAAAPVWLWERIRSDLGVDELSTGYGMTETSAATTLTMPGDPLETISATVGRPKAGGLAGELCEYRTLDPFSGLPLPPGSEGELAVRGAIISHGYYGKPEETTAARDADGWLRSGDLGYVGPDGYLRITGRSKELYKCGGEQVAPREVEDLLTGHPKVAQAYVVGVRDELMGEVGVAWVVPSGDAPDPEELLRHCAEHLARFKVPREVRYIAATALPTTSTGKVQKYRLIEMAATAPS
ncbi:MAG: class I adenylate-forming enzyme family protein [Candidatus Dormibacteria bacterium]